jgi:hypothetical protein
MAPSQPALTSSSSANSRYSSHLTAALLLLYCCYEFILGKLEVLFTPHCCFTAALLLLYCCYEFILGKLEVLLTPHCCFTAALLLLYCCYEFILGKLEVLFTPHLATISCKYFQTKTRA